MSRYSKAGNARLEIKVIFGNFEGIWNLGGSRVTSIWAQNFDLGARGECPGSC